VSCDGQGCGEAEEERREEGEGGGEEVEDGAKAGV